MFESLMFGAYDWLWIAVVLAAAVSLLALWSYLGRRRVTASSFTAMLLKCVAVAALAFCLLEPQVRIERPRRGANILAVMVDSSRSMQIRPSGSTHSRAEGLRPWLRTKSAWQTRAAQDFEVRRYRFDQHLQSVPELEELDFTGQHSALASSLDTLHSRFAQRSVAGTLLFTDGLATDDVERVLQKGDFPFPLYPVIESAARSLRDISLSHTSVSVSPFELAPARVEASLAVQGLSGRDVVVSLLAADGSSLEQQRFTVDDDPFERKVRFQFQPSEPGLQFVELRAQLASEMAAVAKATSTDVVHSNSRSETTNPTWSVGPHSRSATSNPTRSVGPHSSLAATQPRSFDFNRTEVVSRVEASTANNRCVVAVDRGGGPYRILYVSGRPNWEYKFIRRALEEDIELQFHALVRIAKKEAKFSFGDRVVESANPLKAGFSDDEETVEQYDEPVLLRIGEGAAEALQAGFPSGAEDLFAYHAIILDDVEARFFTQQQMLLVRQFVAERGGGLLMLGGQESFLGGGYRDTPIGEVLPVYLRGEESVEDKTQAVCYRLTRGGALEPWLRLRTVQADEAKRFEEMPEFLTWNVVSGTKPGSELLAELSRGSGGSQPALVSQRFGKGRTLALLVGDFWRWSMRRASLDTDDLAQNWRQIARWLTSDVPRRVQIEIVPPTDPQQPHRLNIVLRDAGFQPLDNANVRLTVTEPDGRVVEVQAQPDSVRRGHYVADYWSALDGGYRCEIESASPDGQSLEMLQSGWTAQPSAAEFARVEPDTALLERLAQASGGEVVELNNLDSFVTSLPTRRVPQTEVRIEPLWHQPWLIALAIGCLCLEWGLRRWKGLA
ncbi:MAG: hypothetical protein IT422_22255 [Pirellulaceae bacterium]|nr:hypothetical protein [Pirellulaceae bacterium]